MLVGPTGGGKTCNYTVLARAITQLDKKGLFTKVWLHMLNPKSITMGQLYGCFNDQTHEWADGVLAYIVRETVKDESGEKHWVMFDGPVDAIWIESMNTVLDDNKKLCLNSGQILTLTPYMTMMFEVEDLSVASPATVSRCWMVYMEPEALGYQPLIDSWIGKLPENIVSKSKVFLPKLKTLLDKLVGPMLAFMRKNVREVVVTANNNLVQSLLRILDCYLVGFTDTETRKYSSEELETLEQALESLFYFALTWSLGATGDYESRDRINQYLVDCAKSHNIVVPSDSNWYESFFDIQNRTFLSWNTRYQEFQVEPKLGYHEVMIPTADSTRNIYLLQLLIQNGKHVMNPGPTGTGKTQNIQDLLSKQLGDEFMYISLTFSA